jgi:amidophosphoribosyltransferase
MIPPAGYNGLKRFAAKAQSDLLLGHVRYATAGAVEASNIHPAIATKGRARVAIVVNGEVSFTARWRQEAACQGIDLGDAHTDSAACAGLILSRYLEEADPQAALTSFYRDAFPFGGFTILGLIEGHRRAYFFYLRDGLRPLCRLRVGQTWLFASETAHLMGTGVETEEKIASVPAGEIGICSLKGPGQGSIRPAPEFCTLDMNKELGGTASKGLCAFELAYLQRVTSTVGGRTVDSVRKEFGQALCQDNPPAPGSLIVPVPDSGISAGEGYFAAARARSLNVRMLPDILQVNKEGRSFLENGPAAIANRLRSKFSVDPSLAGSSRTVVVDDSIVRGNFSAWFASVWHQYRRNGLSILSAWPPIIAPCRAGIDIRPGELLATRFLPAAKILCEYRLLEKEMRQGFSHPEFGRVEGLEFRYANRERIRSILGSVLEGKICTGCFDLDYNYIHPGNRHRPPAFLLEYLEANGAHDPLQGGG